MPEVPQHKHCPICGRVMSAKKEACSSECEKQLEANKKKMKMYYYMMMALMAVFIAVFLVTVGGR